MCIFCKIINKELVSTILWEDNEFILIKDLHPKAPVHFLLITKKHFEGLNDIADEVLDKAMKNVKLIAKQFGFAELGYKVNIHCGKDGGQEIFHFHVHILSNFNYV